MPYSNERATASGGFDVLNDPAVRAFLESVEVVRDHSGRIGYIREKLLNVSDLVRDLTTGTILASDASPYESVARKDIPSVRLGVIKFSNVVIFVDQYRRLRDRNEVFVDPVDIARLKKKSNQSKVILPGAGITRFDHPKSKSFFRATVFNDVFNSPDFACLGVSLYDTFCELLRKSGRSDAEDAHPRPGREDEKVIGSVIVKDGKQWIEFARKSPIDGTPLRSNLLVPLDPGYLDIDGDPSKRVYVTDALRIQEVFSEEGSNMECFNRLMSVLEHLLIIHLIRASHLSDPSIVANLNVIVDGPLAIFGEAARFHRSIMAILSEIKADCQHRRMRGPIVMGVSKTGKVVEHASLIENILMRNEANEPLEGTYILPVSDEYRSTFISPDEIGTTKNFGDETYYGQTFLVRSSKKKVFDVTLAYPFPRKTSVGGVPFKDAKVDLANYGDDISHMISVIEMMQTDLYQNALIPVHLAHRYASIAHSPGGRSLDRFVREVLSIQREGGK